MNYGELKIEICRLGHRSDFLTDGPPASIVSIIRKVEGRIARELRAREMVVVTILDETSRISGGIYKLPAGLLEEKAYYASGQPGALRKKSLTAIRSYNEVGPVHSFAHRGNATDGGQIEFRGIPGTGAEIELLAVMRPAALSGDSDTNALLTSHEDLYVQGGLGYLYEEEENFDDAAKCFAFFTGLKDSLNKQAAQYYGGTDYEPAHNLGHVPTGGAY